MNNISQVYMEQN